MELADFYARLRLVVDFPELGPGSAADAAALLDRSVEFALNGARWRPEWLDPAAGRRVLGVTVEDRYGRYGLSGVCVAGPAGDALVVDALALNCRVLGKQVELHLLRRLAELAGEAGASSLRLAYEPTPRNGPFRQFLAGLVPDLPATGPVVLARETAANPRQHRSARTAGRGAARLPVSPRRDTGLMAGIARTFTSGARIAEAVTRRPARTARPGGPVASGDLERRLSAIWQDVLGLDSIGVEDGFFDLGGHSLAMVRLYSRLCDELGRSDLTMVDLFHHPTVRRLAAFLDGTAEPAVAVPAVRAEPAPDTIAVIGLACRTPGAADPTELWAALTGDRELLDTLEETDDPSVVPTLGWLADHDAFDADFFGLSPREAETTDPQHRVLLECAWAALEDAGRIPGRFPGTVGVYAGSGESDHLVRLLARPELVRSLGATRLRLTNLKDYLAPRLAHRLGLNGPAITVQTACSTSLVAVHLARRALLAGECDMAIAGGVSITSLEREGYRYEEGGIFAKDGHCRPFAPDATGTVPGNGVGLVVLRRLADAVRDGDPVRAVIRGSAVNNDGPARAGFTAPGVDGQVQVIGRALADAGLDPDEVDVVEAHGTGTVLGDAIERAALGQVFGRRDHPLWIGSVKSNVGHLDTAAGVIGLIKTVLAVEHARLPASLHAGEPGDGAVRVNVATRPWPAGDGRPRRAGVSSFGMGGTNAHVIVEEAPARDEPDEPRRPELVVVSAADARGRDEAVDRLRRWAARHPDGSIADVAATLRLGREHLPFRASLTCPDVGTLARTAPEGWVRGGPGERPVVFAFPGQGVRVPGLGAGLHAEESVFRDVVDEAAGVLSPYLGHDVRDVMFDPDGRLLDQTRYLQPALFVLEYALARLWQSYGVEPVAMIGHSLGEYTAATLSGVLTLDDALALVAERGRLMQRMPPGAMLAVALPEEELAERIPERLLDALDVAAVNGPAQCAFAGSPDAIADLARFAADARLPHRRLTTAHAFHSRLCASAAAEYAELAARRSYAEPGIPYVSNVSGDWVGTVAGGYWPTQLRETVRFSAGMRTVLTRHPDAVFLEVGPGSTLSGMVRQHQPGAPRRTSLPRSADPASERRSLLDAAGALWCDGVRLRWETIAPGGRIIPLPTYPFRRRTFPVPPPPGLAPSSAPAPPRQDEHPAPAAALERLEPLMGLFWEELLGTGDLRSCSDFIALGGDSLVAARLVARVADVLGVELPVRTVFDNPILGAQARALEEAAHEQLGQERAAELLAEAGALAHERGTGRQE